MMLLSIFEIWDKLPTHVKIILVVSTILPTLVKPSISIFKWLKEKEEEISEDTEEDISVPISIKISPKKRKIKWYKEKLNNHNLFFQINELIKYEIDTNKFIFGSTEKTRIFRQILRIYLGICQENLQNFYNNKIELDKLTNKEFSEHFDNFIFETNTQVYKKFQDSFSTPIFNLVIMNEEKGFVSFMEITKKNFINSSKDIIKQDVNLYDSTNYRKVWEILSIFRLLLNVGLEVYSEFFDQFNGDFDEILKNQ